MSWDAKALLVLTIIWAFIAAIFVPVLGMVEGARGWGVGAVVFLLLFLWLWRAERRGAEQSRPHEEEQRSHG